MTGRTVRTEEDEKQQERMKTMNQLMQEIEKRIVFCDGGMGSLLQARGLLPGELPETWNVLHPEDVTMIHKEYIEAGADIIATNTFGANKLKVCQNI